MTGQDMRANSIFESQHVATRCNKVVKRVQDVAPNNDVICCVQMVRSLARSFTTLSIAINGFYIMTLENTIMIQAG